ncbi:uncharacterized protein LAJ45_10715 [Morchella importuna]|uniref:uncharacterized protein n=1 Tax=Morchella importuna TaxID=1174673 RepID=UPI001E8D8F7B|nr:uncharacterized protein LAJ45_10715 [Morchella importuna]KAH8145278.1 hypothetical protein LAJ45_10715 [Morchella importuna]
MSITETRLPAFPHPHRPHHPTKELLNEIVAPSTTDFLANQPCPSIYSCRLRTLEKTWRQATAAMREITRNHRQVFEPGYNPSSFGVRQNLLCFGNVIMSTKHFLRQVESDVTSIQNESPGCYGLPGMVVERRSISLLEIDVLYHMYLCMEKAWYRLLRVMERYYHANMIQDLLGGATRRREGNWESDEAYQTWMYDTLSRYHVGVVVGM